MTEPVPYNTNPELSTMKEDIAQRNYQITMKEVLIGGAVIAAGVATGGLLGAAMMIGTEVIVIGAAVGGMAGLMGGAMIAGMSTMKERAKLKIDEDMVQSYTQGKNYWGEGYREEVAEHGYGGPQSPTFQGSPPPRNPKQPSRMS